MHSRQISGHLRCDCLTLTHHLIICHSQHFRIILFLSLFASFWRHVERLHLTARLQCNSLKHPHPELKVQALHGRTHCVLRKKKARTSMTFGKKFAKIQKEAKQNTFEHMWERFGTTTLHSLQTSISMREATEFNLFLNVQYMLGTLVGSKIHRTKVDAFSDSVLCVANVVFFQKEFFVSLFICGFFVCVMDGCVCVGSFFLSCSLSFFLLAFSLFCLLACLLSFSLPRPHPHHLSRNTL